VNKALLDTDILSEIIKGIDQTVARNAAAYYQAFGQFTLSAVTVMEIVQGFQKKQSFRKLQSFLAQIAAEEVIDFDRTHGALAGRIAGELERIGQPIGTPDSMIAAIALEHSLELVTGNTAHFQRVQQLGYPLTLARAACWDRPRPGSEPEGRSLARVGIRHGTAWPAFRLAGARRACGRP
jgi:tRNA(fMet)-specific endonuclease VapC